MGFVSFLDKKPAKARHGRERGLSLGSDDLIAVEPAAPVSRAKPSTRGDTSELKIAQWYIKQAEEFERGQDERDSDVKRILSYVAAAAVGFGLICCIGMVVMAVFKRPNPPPVMEVDKATGTVRLLPTKADGHVTWDVKVDRHNLEDYVVAREGYDWWTINDMFGKVKLESDPQEQSKYETGIRGEKGPLKMYGDTMRILVKAGPVNFVGDTAEVLYCRRFIPSNVTAKPPKPEYGIATIAYRYVNIPERTAEQDLDPTGFRVASYTTAPDWTRGSTDTNGACQ